MDINNLKPSASFEIINANTINKTGDINNKVNRITEIPNNNVSNDKLDGKNQRNFNERDVDAAVDKLNKILFKNNTHLQFKVHEKTHDVMVKIVNDETGEVIKEIPPEKIIDMVAKMCETLGIFVDDKK